jgi:hypothetical protein
MILKNYPGNAVCGVPEVPIGAAIPTRPTDRHGGRSLQICVVYRTN